VLTDFGHGQRSQLQKLDSPGQRLGRLLNQGWPRRTQHQKSPRPALRIDQRTQDAKQIWPQLHLVQNHQPVCQRLQKQFRLGQLGEIGRALQVEHHRLPAKLRSQLACHGRFAHLPWANQAHHREGLQTFKQL